MLQSGQPMPMPPQNFPQPYAPSISRLIPESFYGYNTPAASPWSASPERFQQQNQRAMLSELKGIRSALSRGMSGGGGTQPLYKGQIEYQENAESPNVQVSDKPVEFPEAIAPTPDGQKVDLWQKVESEQDLSEYETQLLFRAIDQAKAQAHTPDQVIDSEYADEYAQEKWVENRVKNAPRLPSGHIDIAGLPLENGEAHLAAQISLDYFREHNTFPNQEEILDKLMEIGVMAWDFAIGDDIHTLMDPQAAWYLKVLAASQFIPVMKVTKAFKLIKYFVKAEKIAEVTQKSRKYLNMLETSQKLGGRKQFSAINNIMQEATWSVGKYGSKEANLVKHYSDHVLTKGEFPGMRTVKEYVDRAQRFYHQPPQGTIARVIKDPNTGEYKKIFYHQKSNIMIITRNGEITSMMSPKDKLDYFLKQYTRSQGQRYYGKDHIIDYRR